MKFGIQAIKWIDELYETVIKDYNEIVCDEDELRILREDKRKLEETSLVRIFSSLKKVDFLPEHLRVRQAALRNIQSPTKGSKDWKRFGREICKPEF